jgi:hypothetical protein
MRAAIPFTEVHDPESDGKPMGETDDHRDQMVRHIELLRHFYGGQQVYVSGALLVYYEQGNPRKFVVPDAFVVTRQREAEARQAVEAELVRLREELARRSASST